MTTHTRGPWRIGGDDGSIWVRPLRGNVICDLIARDTCNPATEEDMANANLIAAAPELLEALKRIVEDLPAKRDWLDPAVERAAKEAIRKAKSE